MSAEDVFSFAKEIIDSIMCLHAEGHHLHAATLTYVAIEQMAWLSVEPLKSDSADFKAWVTTYMQDPDILPCTARELWEARNGLLHMGTAESSANRNSKEIRRVCYVYGITPELANKSKEAVFVRVEDLITSYLTGVSLFLSDLNSNPRKLNVAKGKLDRMLTQRPLIASIPHKTE